jgi:hypothetical protein
VASGVGLDGDIHGAGAEGADQEPGEAAGATDGLELEMIAGGEVQIERLPVPGIVDAQLMVARSDWNRDGAAVHEFRYTLAVELDDDLAELDIFGRGPADGNLRLRDLWRRGGHGRSSGQREMAVLLTS